MGHNNLHRRIIKNFIWTLYSIWAVLYKKFFLIINILIGSFFRKQFTRKEVSKILIIRTDHLGDLVITTPALQTIRKYFPNAKITLLVKDQYVNLMQQFKVADKVLPFPGILGLYSLRHEKFDLAISYKPNTFLLYLILLLMGIKYRVGFDIYGNGITLTTPVTFRYLPEFPSANMREIVMDIPRELGINIRQNNFFLHKPTVNAQNKISKKITNIIGNKKRLLIGMCVGTNRKNTFIDKITMYITIEKRVLPINMYVDLSEWLLKKYSSILFFIGTKDERAYIDSIIQKIGNPNVVNLAGETSPEDLYDLISRLNLLISNDTGPLHIADIIQKPLVTIFGYSDPDIWGPFGKYNYGIARRSDLSCSPCQRMTSKTDYFCNYAACTNRLHLSIIKNVTQSVIEKMPK